MVAWVPLAPETEPGESEEKLGSQELRENLGGLGRLREFPESWAAALGAELASGVLFEELLELQVVLSWRKFLIQNLYGASPSSAP